MEVAKDFFAVPTFGMFAGAASRGCQEETPAVVGGTGSCLPSRHAGYHPGFFAPRCRLRLGGEQEETSVRKQICRISHI